MLQSIYFTSIIVSLHIFEKLHHHVRQIINNKSLVNEGRKL